MGFEERRIGTVIGKWRVDSLLGAGSMAAVYAVTHRNGSRAALKILHGQLVNDDAVVERFLSEGYLANVVKHPGIVRVFDDGMTDEGCPFLAMEMLEGETLEDYCEAKGPRLDVETTVAIADAIMDVLAAVHAGGVIHRDLKPSNVFLTSEREVKLLDFGVAKLSDKKSVSKLSLVGMVLGTPAYMAPEQALGAREAVDARSDIFAVGAIIFTMLTGENVHPVAGTQQKLLAAATAKARSLGSVMELPPGIIAVVDQALQFKKDDRWQTITQMRNALKEATELARTRSVRPPPPSTARLSSTERSNDGTLVNVKAPNFDETPMMAPVAEAVVEPAPQGRLIKTLLGMPADPALLRKGPEGVMASRAHDLESTQIVSSNPYGLVAPVAHAQATASGQYLAIPDVTDSGRVGHFYGKDQPPSSQIDLRPPKPARPVVADPFAIPNNGSYPSGAETSFDERIVLPRTPRWPIALGLAAVIAIVAGAGVYVQASKSTAKPLPVPSSAPSNSAAPLGTLSSTPHPTALPTATNPTSPTAAPKASVWVAPAKPTPWTPAVKPTSKPIEKPVEKPVAPGPTPPDIEIIE